MVAPPWVREQKPLAANEARVCWLDTRNVTAKSLLAWLDILDEDERRRAAAFRQDQDRHDYLCAHILRRLALSEACGHPPASWRFVTPPGNKPRVVAPQHIETSLSHTTRLVAVALSAHCPVGVDVEQADIPEALAPVICSRQEQHDLPVCAADRQAALRACWALKEAASKVGGQGLKLSPAQMHVFRSDTPHCLLAEAGRPPAWQGWLLQASPWALALATTVSAAVHPRFNGLSTLPAAKGW